MIKLEGTHNNDCKVFIDSIEESAVKTIQSILNDEVSYGVPIRIMPDVHDGVDIVIGFTMPITDRVNPNHIGVDIGCGMLCVKIDKPNLTLEEIDRRIRQVVPMGFNHQTENVFYDSLTTSSLCNKIGLDYQKVCNQLGTLGGGNHFIEIGEFNREWYLTIHSGSRNFGLQVCKYHSDKAKSKGSKYLFGEDMKEYIDDMDVAQSFAFANRMKIEMSILEALEVSEIDSFTTIHNYIDMDKMIIRKGAVSANSGEKLLIPMNMRDGSLLCVGKGNRDWNYSAPHGAGRIYARGRAKRELSLEKFESEMSGIYSTSVCKGTLDESPMAYKSMQTIIDCIEDTVDVIGVINPILNIKSL